MAAPTVRAQTVYGLGIATGPAVAPTGTQLIGSLNVATGTINLSATMAITGVTTGQVLVGMDSRPATGELFVLGYDATTTGINSQLYTLNPGTGVVTLVGNAFRLELGSPLERIGVDFNPTVDRLRVVSSYKPTAPNTNNYRLNPTPGAGGTIAVLNDGVLAYSGGTPADPGVGAAAYTNSAFGASSTVLYDIDEVNGLLVRQDPPNAGTLGGGSSPVAPVAITLNGAGFGMPKAVDVDVYLNPSTGQNQAYLIEVTPGGSSNFYTLNLTTGAATSSGTANVVPAASQVEVRDIAAAIAPRPAQSSLTGQLVYAVTTNNNLITFDTQNPAIIRTLVAITGVGATQTLVGTDFRPNTGQLFGLGYDPAAGANDRVYTINLSTGVATPVGTTDIDLDLGTDVNVIGFDFNPTVDRIRVVSSNDRNYRLNPNTGSIAFIDNNLAYAATDPNMGQNPSAGTAAYVNSFVGATGTGLYVLDHVLGTVSLQSPPNDGVLTTTRPLTGVNGMGVGGSIGALNDFDVYFDGTSNLPYLAAVPAGQTNSRFFSLNGFSPSATTGQVATDLGPIGAATAVRDISIVLAAASTVAATPAVLTGQLVYAVANGNLISFDSNNPGVIRSAVNFGGGIGAGQTVVGTDFRSATGQLFALGYNPALAFPAANAQLYTVNLTTGGLTAVGALLPLDLGTALNGIGFDFNPTVDRIRVTAINRANYRLNPNGTNVVITDSPLTAGPVISASAYTNNQSPGTGTALYAYDATNTQLYDQNPPNAGTLVAKPNPSGIAAPATPAGADFDIFNAPNSATNTAFLAVNPGASNVDSFYEINLSTGVATLKGQIGQGTNVTGLAVFIQNISLLTWNGNVSTDWGTAANWTPAQVPTTTNDVLIVSGTPNQPIVSNAQQARVVTLNNGSVLTLADAGVLNVTGNFVNLTATVTFAGTGTGLVSLTGAAAQTISGTLSTFPNLTVGAASASLGGPVSVRRGLTLTGGLTTTGQTLTLLSGTTGTAYVVNNTGTVTGSATVQRYIDPTRNGGMGYRHYSAPVSGSTVANLATTGFAPVVNPAYNTTGNSVMPFPNVFGYDETRVNPGTASGSPSSAPEFDKGFFSPTATTDALEVTRGYSVNISATATVDFTGMLNNGSFSATGLTRGTQPESGYHLRGNPYPSALDWQSVLTANRAVNIENALYVFKSSGQYTGTYTSYVNGQSTNTGTNVLPVGQGFFVRTVTGQTGSIAFTNADRVAAFDATPFQRAAVADTRPQLTLALSNAMARTQTVMYFEQGATAGFDRAFDAHSLPSPNGLTLATETAATEPLAINGQAALTTTDVLLPLRVASAAAGTYTLSVDNLANLPANYRAYLRDAATGAFTDLATTASVTLNLAANGAAGGRYAVLFTTQRRVLATAPGALAQLVSVYPNPAHGTATLLLPAVLRGNKATVVSVVDNLGRVVLTRTLAIGTGETLDLPLGTLAPGVYSVQAHTAAGLVAKRLVVQ